MKKYMSIKRLLDSALDTTWLDYQRILDRFDGVKASYECEQLFYYIVHDYIADYNASVDVIGMIPADLSTPGRQIMIRKAVVSIIRSAICTTKTGVRYYRFDAWPTDDADLKDMPK